MTSGLTVFSRVTIVAPRTRVDIALPYDVAIADLMPSLLEMTRQGTADHASSAQQGGWCLAKLGEAPLDPSRTLASLGIVDGDLLQLRHRVDAPPTPLYDDVVDAIATATPASFRVWGPQTARIIGHAGWVLGALIAAIAVLMSGPLLPGGNGIAAAIVAGVAMLGMIAVGTTLVKVYAARATGILVAATGLPMAFVCGFYLVPGGPDRANLLLGSVLVVLASIACILLIGAGIVVFIASTTAATLSALAFLVSALLDTQPIAGIAAGAAAVSLVALSLLPRMTIQLTKLPLPQVPSSADELQADSGAPDYQVIESKSELAHEYLTGMIIGSGAITAISAVVAASSGTVWGPIFAGVAITVLLLRSRTYANGSQSVALLICGLTAVAGLLLGWIYLSDWLGRLLWIFGIAVLIGAGAAVLGVVVPNRKFSPVLKRSVDIFEAICIVAVIPLALAVMNMYDTLRHLNF